MKNLLIFIATIILMGGIHTSAETPISLNIWDNVQFPVDNSSSVTGVRLNLLYAVNQDVTGVDWPIWILPVTINIVKGNMTGVQYGLYNQVDSKMTGVQIGLVNNVNSLYGIQLGLVNLNKAGAPIPQDMSKPFFFPFINWAF